MSSEILQEKGPTTSDQPPGGASLNIRTIGKYLRNADLGQLPVLVALLLIGVYFQVTSPNGTFLSYQNLNNLVLQIATIGMLGLASVLVLLIGEIDLSLGVVSYTCAAITAVLSVQHGWSAIPALLAGLGTGALIGLVNGFFVAILHVPSFIVTLAGLLAYQGVVLHILYPQTSLIIVDPYVANIAISYLPDVLGIGLPAAAVLLYAAGVLYARIQRQRIGLAFPPAWATWLRIGVVVVFVAGTVAIFEGYLGVPQSTAILMGSILLFWLIMRFTSFGRHVYAVGGNAEAARRAGINVTGIRITIFVLASTLAAVGGILQASRLDTASADVDQTLLLNAIATAVIGGVSLFGGRGSVWAIVLGSLVIGSLSNGLDLLNQNTDVKFIVEGIVLIIAVTIDALARRRRTAGIR